MRADTTAFHCPINVATPPLPSSATPCCLMHGMDVKQAGTSSSFAGELMSHLVRLLPRAVVSSDTAAIFIECLDPFEVRTIDVRLIAHQYLYETHWKVPHVFQSFSMLVVNQRLGSWTKLQPTARISRDKHCKYMQICSPPLRSCCKKS